jgi:arylsulfatase A-like enzyme
MKLFQLVIAIILIFGISSCSSKQNQSSESETVKPNVVIIYIDDLGYGDVSCYGATKVSTPNIDNLASTGIRFTNGHSSSATCTPSRFSMLTGGYAFRQEGTGIAPGDAAMIVKSETRTLADIFSEAGYRTGVVGKWHLGLGGEGGPDWNGFITPGPQDIGFDYSFLIPATGDRVPCVYTENGRVFGLDPADPILVNYKEKVGNEPTGLENPELLKMQPSHGHNNTIINGISRIGFMTGGNSARWVDEYMADAISQKALDFIEKNKNNSFFLYYSTHDIHVPRVPHPRFAGLSGMGPRGDAILEVDWATGEIMKKLESLGLSEKTIVIFTSDNGPVVDDGYKDQAVELLGDHKPAGPLRGGKYSAFNAGTQVPFILSWPGRINYGESDVLISQVDFMASFAKMLNLKLTEKDAVDSYEMLDQLLGKSEVDREHFVHQGISTNALIQGEWKYIVPTNRPKMNVNTHTEMGTDPEPQLYNLTNDLGETKNLAKENPEKLKELEALFHKINNDGRTRN